MIKDFGQKIGGARKDLWKERGLGWADTETMSEEEKEKYICKDQIWPKYDLSDITADNRFILFWKNEIRKTIYPRPRSSEGRKFYVETVQKIKSMVEDVKSEEDIETFFQTALDGVFMIRASRYTYVYANNSQEVIKGNALLKIKRLDALKRKMEKSGFGLSTEEQQRKEFPVWKFDSSFSIKTEAGQQVLVRVIPGGKSYYYEKNSGLLQKLKSGIFFIVSEKSHRILFVGDEQECSEMQKDLFQKNQKKVSRKRRFVPPQFENLRRTGEDYRNGKDACGNDFLQDFSIRGGEFGNWTNDKERQISLNMAYDALKDLAVALGISDHDIGLRGLNQGSLAIAFGARGHGNAAAHYDFMHEVINLTKLKGAGALSHEWGHALDDLIGKSYKGESMASMQYKSGLPEEFTSLMHDLFYLENGHSTEYFSDSVAFGKNFSKTGHGYWDSPCEMFARAFACYVLDHTEGINDYLNGHAEQFVSETLSGKKVYAFPRGEERSHINERFDALLLRLRKDGIFHEPTFKSVVSSKDDFTVQEDGQLSFNILLMQTAAERRAQV